jgi:hypothetical protein
LNLESDQDSTVAPRLNRICNRSPGFEKPG